MTLSETTRDLIFYTVPWFMVSILVVVSVFEHHRYRSPHSPSDVFKKLSNLEHVMLERGAIIDRPDPWTGAMMREFAEINGLKMPAKKPGVDIIKQEFKVAE